MLSRLVPLVSAFLFAVALVASPAPQAAAQAGASISGTVTGPDSAPPQGGTVWVEVSPTSNHLAGAQVTADPATGAYRIDGLEPGADLRVSFHYEGPQNLLSEYWGGAYYASEATLVTLAEGQELTMDAQLEVGAIIQGSLSTTDGSAVSGTVGVVPVDWGSDRPSFRYGAVTEGATYRSYPLPPGEYEVSWRTEPPLMRVNHNSVSAYDVDQGPPVTVTGNEPVVVDLTTGPWATLRGRILLDRDGELHPYTGPIDIESVSGPDQRKGLGSQVTDGDLSVQSLYEGEYVLRIPERYGAYVLPGYLGGDSAETATRYRVERHSTVTGVEGTAIEGGRFSVRIRYDEGYGLVEYAGTKVSIWRYDADAEAYAPVSTHDVVYGFPFTSPLLPTGRYLVRYFNPDVDSFGAEYHRDARYFVDSTDVTVTAGVTTALEDAVLEPRYFDVHRIAGADRFETAIQISRHLVPAGQRAPVVYLTNAFNFPDALAAGPAAIGRGGVILPTRTGALPASIQKRLAELDPVRVVLLGDENAVSAAVATAVRAVLPGVPVDRLGGSSRYATADLIVRDAFAVTGASTAVIATGRNYPDALAAGAAAGVNDAPVILVDGRSGADGRTLALLRDLGIDEVVIAGGLPSVGAQLEADLRGELGEDAVVRLAGADRYETAALINDFLLGESDYALLATGTNFADALTGGPLAGALGAPLYLSPQSCIPAVIGDAMLAKQVVGIDLLGGEPSLSLDVEDLILC